MVVSRVMPASPRPAALHFVLITVFLDVLGIGLIIPVLPPLVGQFTADAQAQSYWYGWLVSGYGLMQFVAGAALGALSDQVGRRPVLLVSLFGLGVDFLLMALAPTLWVLLLARLIGGGTAATISVANAYIADVTPPQQRGRGFGLVGAMFGLGFIVGPMAGGLLGGIDLRWPFYAAAALTLLNWLFGWWTLPESLPVERRTKFSWARANPFSALRALSQAHGVGRLVGVYALLALAQFTLHSTWVLVAGHRFGWGPTQTGLSLFVVGVASTLMQGLLLGRLIAQFGERRLAIAGMVSGTLAFVAYATVPHGWMVYPVILANLLGFAAMPALQALISRGFDAGRQGLAMGSLNAISGMMTVIAPLLGTALFAQVAQRPPADLRTTAPFWLGAALQGTAALLAWRELRSRAD